MDSETEELLLQKLEELVTDQDIILTTAVICEKLNLSLTDSKYIMEKYVYDEIVKPGKISVTYLVCGKLKSGEYGIQLIDDTKLLEIKKLFNSIYSKTLYSIQKFNLNDFDAIALSEKANFTRESVPKGSIVGEKCVQKLIKTKEFPPLPLQKNFEKQKPSFFKPVAKTEADVFKKENSTTVTKTKSQKSTGGLTGFLSQTSKKQINKTSSEEDIREIKRPRMETNDFDPQTKNEVTQEKIENDNSEKENNKEGANLRDSQEVNSSTQKEGKKRKRIIQQSDSDDDIFANDEVEEMDVNVEEEKSVIIQPKETIPRNKRRKAVEKSYMDEEGYLVTRTEYVLVSASEDEEVKEEVPKKEIKTSLKEEKKSPPQKTIAKGKKAKAIASNQPTLMNFFKKK